MQVGRKHKTSQKKESRGGSVLEKTISCVCVWVWVCVEVGGHLLVLSLWKSTHPFIPVGPLD